MRKYVIRRLLLIFPTALLLSLLIFGLLRVVPGDAALMLLTDEGSKADPEVLKALRHRLGLDRPLHVQYVTWLWDMVRGNFGESLVSRVSIGDQILQRLPLTLQIALMAQFMSLLIGVPIGIISAVRRNTWLDYALRVVSILFLTAPTFWVGLLIVLVGAIWFNYSPPIGYNLIWDKPIENILQLMWPAIILASHGLATTARMTRSTMLEVMGEDYIRTARAKGLRESIVVFRHALKNALIPVVTLTGLSFAGLLGGTVVLEFIFGIPGIGSWLVQSIQTHDYSVVQSLVVVLAVTFMLINLLVDLFYGWLDPRISYS
ncbi:MAG: ABC transporter permease [Dehalococcoidia bacterium]|nr:ABC transporter permease [Dehalococcoidia bacterium]